MKDSKNPYHPDIAIFLVLIPFISAVNYYLTYTNIRFGGFLLLTFSIDTLQGYAAWWAVRWFIFYLDRRIPVEQQPGRRILIQLAATLLIGLFIIALLTEIVSLVAKGKTAPLSFYSVDLFIIGIWFFVVNGVYLGLRFYNQWQRSEYARKEENKIRLGGLIVRQGKQDLKLEFDQLAALYVDGEYVAAFNAAGHKYYLDQSLDKIEEGLPSTHFFRLNRQFIVHRKFVTGFRRSENGKVTALIEQLGSLPPEVPVSRTKAPSFKSWFRPED